MTALDRLQLADFDPHCGSTFRLGPSSFDAAEPVSIAEALEVELTEAKALGPAPEGGRQPFSLLFRAAAGQPFEQGVYRLEHPQLGDLDLFLVPVDQRDGSRFYEAVFT